MRLLIFFTKSDPSPANKGALAAEAGGFPQGEKKPAEAGGFLQGEKKPAEAGGFLQGEKKPAEAGFSDSLKSGGT